MADVGRLRQAGGAGGVDQQRAVGERDRRAGRAPPARRRRSPPAPGRGAASRPRPRRAARAPDAPAGPAPARSAASSAASTMIARAPATSRQWASEAPRSWVLISAVVTPMRDRPSQTARYSGRFGISSATTSPLPRPCVQRPAGVAVRALGELAEAEALAVGQQRRRIGLARRQLVDHRRQRALRLALQPRRSAPARAASPDWRTAGRVASGGCEGLASGDWRRGARAGRATQALAHSARSGTAIQPRARGPH